MVRDIPGFIDGGQFPAAASRPVAVTMGCGEVGMHRRERTCRGGFGWGRKKRGGLVTGEGGGGMACVR